MISFPQVNIPLSISQDIMAISQQRIEEVAANTRKYWGLGNGPISNMALLLENNGVIIMRTNLFSPALDAFSTWSTIDNTPYMILGSDKGSPTRSRFDAAHELGHLILHRNVDESKLNNTHLFKLIEQQANCFASAFLVPPEALAEDYAVPTLDALLLLKERWRVSVGMLIMTIANLGFITEEYERRLWINYNRRGWRKSEPREDRIPTEPPVLLERACRLLIRERVKTAQEILNEIPLSEADIEELMNLENGSLKPIQPTISLKDDEPPASPSEYKDALAEVEDILRSSGS
jgi:Zn-dependent peptidase ImmA (M78 family)